MKTVWKIHASGLWWFGWRIGWSVFEEQSGKQCSSPAILNTKKQALRCMQQAFHRGSTDVTAIGYHNRREERIIGETS